MNFEETEPGEAPEGCRPATVNPFTSGALIPGMLLRARDGRLGEFSKMSNNLMIAWVRGVISEEDAPKYPPINQAIADGARASPMPGIEPIAGAPADAYGYAKLEPGIKISDLAVGAEVRTVEGSIATFCGASSIGGWVFVRDIRESRGSKPRNVAARATVTMHVQVDIEQKWGSDCSVSQVHDQASREAVARLSAALRGNLNSRQFRICGEPLVTAVSMDRSAEA